jgi:hypothetical protein
MARFGVVVVAVMAASCGGEGAADAPKLPHALGASLAAQASAVESSLAGGNACAAAAQATQLEGMVADAIDSGRVPVTLRAPLTSSVASLADEISCVPLPPAPTGGPPGKKPGHGPDKKHDHGPGKDHGPGHDKKHGPGHDGDGGGD